MNDTGNRLKLTGISAALLMGMMNSIGQALVFELGKDIHVLWIIGIQSIIAVLLVLVFSLLDGKIAELRHVWSVPVKSWFILHARSLVCVIGGLGLIYQSYKYLPLSTASWFMAIPLATVWAFLLLQEKITKRECIALFVGCVGLLLVSTQKGAPGAPSNYLGFVFISLGVVGFSLGWVLSRNLIEEFGERSFNIVSNATIGFYAVLIAFIWIDPPLLNTRAIVMLTLRGLILGIVSMLFSRTIKCLKITKGLILTRLENVYAVIIGVSVFGEEFSLTALCGVALLLSASILASKS